MSLKFNVAFWCIVGAQLLVLMAMIGVKEATLQTGTEVVLQTVPVDPRSLMQGDYAILNYEISRMDSRFLWRGDQAAPPRGAQFYVTLREAGEVWVATGYEESRDEAGTVAIRGVVDDDGRLDFGIGTYFVPEGTGLAIERARDVKVRVAVSRNGDAVIKEVIVNGLPFSPGQ